MTDEDAHARILQRRGGVRLADVAPADLVAASKEHAGESRHPRAADAHQVHLHFPATSCRTASTRWAASRRPAAFEAFAIARKRSAVRSSRAATRLVGLSSASPMLTAAPASTIAFAFSSWWPPPNVPGTRTIGRPTGAISAILLPPARLSPARPVVSGKTISGGKVGPREQATA